MTESSSPDSAPSKSRFRRPLIIGAAALAAVVATGGISAAAAHKQVEVEVDGDVQDVSTFAGSVSGALDAADISTSDHDMVVPGPDESLSDGDTIVVRMAEQVEFVVDEEPTQLWTIGRTAGEALADVADRGESVAMEPSRSGDGRPELDLPLVEDGEVTFQVDDDEETVTIDGTAELDEALDEADIDLNELDETQVEATDDGAPEVTVTRITEEEEETTEEVEFETETHETDDLYEGEEEVVQAGEAGERTIVTWERTVDGDVVEEDVRSDEVTTEPVTKIVEVGTKTRPAPEPEANDSDSGDSGDSGESDDSGGGEAPSEGVWSELAQCESGGDPSAVSASGQYHGLYQFSVATWQAMGGSGLPSEASAGEQTERAKKLQSQSGWGQWPACAAQIGLL